MNQNTNASPSYSRDPIVLEISKASKTLVSKLSTAAEAALPQARHAAFRRLIQDMVYRDHEKYIFYLLRKYGKIS